MWGIMGVIMVTTMIFFIEYPTIRKHNSPKDKWTFLVLLSLGLTLSILKLTKIPLFNPMKVIEYVYKPFYDNVFNWLL